MRGGASDMVDLITSQWRSARPDVDVSPIHVIGRISRLSRLIDRRLAENFARHRLESWEYDVLATLRRSGAPYELAAGDLVRQTMVTTGAITNRIDRLERRGLVERGASPLDRRKVIVRLTRAGVQLVDEVVATHMATERALLGALTARQRRELAALLRATLLHLGDGADGLVLRRARGATKAGAQRGHGAGGADPPGGRAGAAPVTRAGGRRAPRARRGPGRRA